MKEEVAGDQFHGLWKRVRFADARMDDVLPVVRPEAFATEEAAATDLMPALHRQDEVRTQVATAIEIVPSKAQDGGRGVGRGRIWWLFSRIHQG